MLELGFSGLGVESRVWGLGILGGGSGLGFVVSDGSGFKDAGFKGRSVDDKRMITWHAI